jgi:hypothetical protein
MTRLRFARFVTNKRDFGDYQTSKPYPNCVDIIQAPSIGVPALLEGKARSKKGGGRGGARGLSTNGRFHFLIWPTAVIRVSTRTVSVPVKSRTVNAVLPCRRYGCGALLGSGCARDAQCLCQPPTVFVHRLLSRRLQHCRKHHSTGIFEIMVIYRPYLHTPRMRCLWLVLALSNKYAQY